MFNPFTTTFSPTCIEWMEAPTTPGKRARKKTVRLSESDSYGEPPKKRSKVKPESVDVPVKRTKGKSQVSGSKVKLKVEKESTTRRGKDGKFVVSLNLGLLDSSEKRGGGSNGRGESAHTARKAVPMKFKNPEFNVCKCIHTCTCTHARICMY